MNLGTTTSPPQATYDSARHCIEPHLNFSISFDNNTFSAPYQRPSCSSTARIGYQNPGRHTHVLEMDEPIERGIPELDDQANRIVALIVKIIELLSVDIRHLLKDDISRMWECEYRCTDLTEQVWKLKKQLRESIPLEHWLNPPPQIRNALEAGQDRRIEELRDRIVELETKIRELEAKFQPMSEKLIRVMSHNWELGYKCKDLSGDLWRLKGQLRTSIALGDLAAPPLKPKTALERALEKKIDELEGRGKHPRRKARSKSI
ncbi:hypothetical protein QBC46DRAFT_90889 [Diplogelasinospora grovesii]|uniref:Uncharacterized protein n=1 Tax=Diplogelasinospora grovesii TaxID=303347 RepID=A0AAN6MVE7_9PEZI|nr:hypothetical protein QBC46DRAFT_90889 [Diplogelasinospora grovesii]